MAGPEKVFETADLRDKTGTQGIQVDIAYEFEKIRIFFAKDRFVAVLEKMAYPSMTPVEVLGVSGQETAHDGRER
jgi:hypothetical protein